MYFWIVFNFVLFSTTLISRKRLYLIWIFLALFSAFRYNIGPDYLQYELSFSKIIDGNEFFLLASDYFHIQLVYLSNYIGAKNQFVILVYSILTLYIYYKAFKYYSSNNISFLILTLLFTSMMYFGTLNTIRQALAGAIFFYATRYIIEKNFFLYFIFMIGAILVHKSSIILVPLYWISRIRFNYAIIVSIIILSIFFIFFNPISYISQFFIKFNLPFSIYFDYGRFSKPPTLYVKIIALINILTVGILIFLDRTNRTQNMIFNFILIMVLIRSISLHMDVIGRLTYFFKPFLLLTYMFTILFFLNKVKSYKNNFVVFIVIFLYAFINVQLNIIIEKANAYDQYSINLNLFTKPDPIQIFGDYRKVRKWEK